MRLAVGGDHAGFSLKGTVVKIARDLGHEVTDFGSHDEAPVDFPDIARAVCGAVVNGTADRGIMVCGTGVGAAIAANKIPGIRASIVHDGYIAHQCVEHDDVNVMCVGAKIVGAWLLEDLLKTFLKARFDVENESFVRRVRKLHEMDGALGSKTAAR